MRMSLHISFDGSFVRSAEGERGGEGEEGQLVLRARIRIPRVAIASRGARKGEEEDYRTLSMSPANIPLRRGQLTRTPR